MRLQLRFRGRVQGVGFRATSLACARDLPLTGWVRNEPDGSVLLEVQGSRTDTDLLLRRIAERMSRNITHTDRFELPDRENERGFAIQR